MKLRWIWAVLAAGTLSSAASGADLRVVTGVAVPSRLDRPVARLADQGLGYSVAHESVGLSPRPYRVHVTCTIDESFMQTYCPTAAYYSSCPRARIDCQ